MSKKKKKNSNYSGVVDTKILTYKKVAPKKSFFETYKKQIIIAVSAVLAVALIVGLIFALLPDGGTYVELDFGNSYGKVVIKLDEENAPITTKNFISLVERGFYDGLTIFRAQKNFVIQGGEDKKSAVMPIVGEFAENGYTNPISHKRGVISMARSDEYDSATSQFFITLHDDAAESLDGKYAGFGYVVEGMDVVDAIAEDLYPHAMNSMGFVSDTYAITIVSAKIIDYK